MSQNGNSKYLELMESDLEEIRPLILEITGYILKEGISDYPVLVAGRGQAPIGKLFASAEKLQLHFDYNITIVEDLVKRGIVDADKLDDFKKTFGNPEEKACIFVMLPEHTGFIFVRLGHP